MSMDLPTGWERTTLGIVAPLAYGKALPQGSRSTLGSVPVFGSSGCIDWTDHALTAGPTLIVGRKGSVGSVFVSDCPCWPIDTVYYVNASPQRNLKFLRYLIESLSLQRLDKSTAVPGLSRDDYNVVEVRLPPLAEQSRIVGVLEEHLSDLDHAVANLKSARSKTSAYLAASFNAAAMGTLLSDQPSGDKLEWRPFSSTIADISQGWSPKCHPEPPTIDDQWGVIKTTAIQPARFDSSECKALPQGFQPRPDIEIRVGDLLVTRKGPRSRAGVAAAVRQTRSRLMICDTVYRIRLKSERARPHFMAIVMSSPTVSSAIDRAKAGISESGLSLTHDRLGAVLVPLPPLDAQERIEAEMDRRIEAVERAYADIDLQLARAARLRLSICQSAVSGRLVPQDPTEKSAGALLAEVRSQSTTRATSSSSPRGLKRATTPHRANG
ncbi:restriction endonuclease subunit S [Gemmatimonas sp.]|uniref:restriction endonuclease subunit S n=1 Tax=Gemmatimonas sp. TaxID=1962908 RepID=UPI0025BB1784|nr:restriction endonuclease subunit S [Gemmatimonas sp.]MCA2993951.1 restriction endonuclease subunit S [Gemmatimonas sp.]